MDLREFKQKSCKEPLHTIEARLPHCLRDNIRRVKLKSDTSKEKTKPSFYFTLMAGEIPDYVSPIECWSRYLTRHSVFTTNGISVNPVLLTRLCTLEVVCDSCKATNERWGASA